MGSESKKIFLKKKPLLYVISMQQTNPQLATHQIQSVSMYKVYNVTAI